jgi:phosphatidylserine/phosphatidylglycerophosphate/cardiolipin synthase-like enzyme
MEEIQRGEPPLRVLKPGRNCWKVASADRAAVLIDGQSYFGRLEQALLAARRSILILGWDFDASIKLRGNADEHCPAVGDFLRSLVEGRPELSIRILVWNLATLHAPSDPLPLIFGDRWQEHERIALRLDGRHPIYAAQHQKIIAIDDSLAFVGGMDLTVDRWDTSEHGAEEPNRSKPDGTPFGPVHDMQLLFDGEAAAAVAMLARQRWRVVTGETVEPSGYRPDAWPSGLEAEFHGVPLGIARTRPTWRGERGIGEGAKLAADALRAARRSIYIEAQYFTHFATADILAEHLRRPDGPEIVIVVSREMHGSLERLIMGANRNRLIRRLQRADRFNRLRIYHPVVPGAGADTGVLIHAKLIIVDDDVLRIGSSNLNNRSVGLDTECDVAIEATGDEVRATIAGVRARLVAEHLGTNALKVAELSAATGSLIKAIEQLNTGHRRLERRHVPEDGPDKPFLGTRFLDPQHPYRLLSWLPGGRWKFRGVLSVTPMRRR